MGVSNIKYARQLHFLAPIPTIMRWRMKYKLSQYVVSDKIDDDNFLLLNMESGLFFNINDTAMEICKYIENDYHDTHEIVLHIANEYEIDQKQINNDINMIIEKMFSLGILQCTE